MDTKKLKKLKEPISPKWRVQSAIPKNNPTHVMMVAYTDARGVQDRLDEVVGMENWQVRYYECMGKQFCEIGIRINGEWIWKGDSGSKSKTEAEKGETSDSFKRASVAWGIGREMYQYGVVKLNARKYGSAYYPCDSSGNFLKGDKLYELCNSMTNKEELEVEFDNEIEERDLATALIECENRDDKIKLWGSLSEEEQLKFKKLFECYEV